ncbi:hypothetical protein DL769_003854 [Monosporascus sp. CRB-8-3]|nr:hypothetical protein DL769_003854 [Monosporascus sp. CRB-8-3]
MPFSRTATALATLGSSTPASTRILSRPVVNVHQPPSTPTDKGTHEIRWEPCPVRSSRRGAHGFNELRWEPRPTCSLSLLSTLAARQLSTPINLVRQRLQRVANWFVDASPILSDNCPPSLPDTVWSPDTSDLTSVSLGSPGSCGRPIPKFDVEREMIDPEFTVPTWPSSVWSGSASNSPSPSRSLLRPDMVTPSRAPSPPSSVWSPSPGVADDAVCSPITFRRLRGAAPLTSAPVRSRVLASAPRHTAPRYPSPLKHSSFADHARQFRIPAQLPRRHSGVRQRASPLPFNGSPPAAVPSVQHVPTSPREMYSHSARDEPTSVTPSFASLYDFVHRDDPTTVIHSPAKGNKPTSASPFKSCQHSVRSHVLTDVNPCPFWESISDTPSFSSFDDDYVLGQPSRAQGHTPTPVTRPFRSCHEFVRQNVPTTVIPSCVPKHVPTTAIPSQRPRPWRRPDGKSHVRALVERLKEEHETIVGSTSTRTVSPASQPSVAPPPSPSASPPSTHLDHQTIAIPSPSPCDAQTSAVSPPTPPRAPIPTIAIRSPSPCGVSPTVVTPSQPVCDGFLTIPIPFEFPRNYSPTDVTRLVTPDRDAALCQLESDASPPIQHLSHSEDPYFEPPYPPGTASRFGWKSLALSVATATVTLAIGVATYAWFSG